MANILGVQIIGLLFSLFMIYYMFLHYKRKEFTGKEYIFWMVFWSVFIVITLFPQILDPVLSSLNLARTMDFFIIAGFLFLIFISMYSYTLLRKNQKKLEEVVRQVAMRKDK